MKLDWISILIVGVMICVTIVACFYYMTFTTNECVKSPLIYGAKYYSDLYSRDVFGVLYIAKSGEFGSIYFNSNNISKLID